MSLNANHRPPQELLQALRGIRRPFIVAHVTPDADAVGAALGLTAAFREHGIEATAGVPEGSISLKLRFMLGLADTVPIATLWDPAGRFDAAVVLDTASAKRINILPAIDLSGPLPVFNIDHHLTNTNFGRHNWVDPDATSTCELVARLIEGLGWTPSQRVASLLFCGIHGDTAGFSLPATSAAALQTAATLLRAGADVGRIGEQLCRSQERAEFELLKRVYDHTRVIADGQIAYSYVSHEDITGAGCTAADIDDQVNVPRSLRGVRIALLFSEGEKGVIRVNLRGEGEVTVLEIARKFDGGGHSQSAGTKFHDMRMDEAIRAVCDAAIEHLRALDAQHRPQPTQHR